MKFAQVVRISSILILSFLCIHCRPADTEPSVSIVSKNDKAIGVVIRGIQLGKKELSARLKIQLAKTGERVPVLGEFRQDDGEIIFEPIVPLTRGLTYEIFLDDTLLSTLEIPLGNFSAPQLLSIFPSQDTLPENLLKMYFQFSAPMAEGRSLNYITLVRDDGDTLKGTFLDLQPELWNADGTVLTLWLDPGRIKRDLIPNKELGTPLRSFEHYTLHVDKLWTSKNGLTLSKNFTKTFFTIQRDDDPPDLATWIVRVPAAGTQTALEVHFPQPLDYFLLKEGITVKNLSGNLIPGEIEIDVEEKIFRFTPREMWYQGKFNLQVEGRLEDLSGNNLNRPFDRDVAERSNQKERKIFIREFEIR